MAIPTRYKVTLGNFLAIAALGCAVYCSFFDGPESWGMVVAIYLAITAFVILAVDFFLQRILHRYLLINIIEIVLLALAVVYLNLE